jgi:hypothetical protein
LLCGSLTQVAHGSDEHPNFSRYCSNSISTSKYTLLSFLPK